MREDPRIVFCYVGAPHPFLSQMPKDRLDVYPPTQFVPQYYWLMSKIPAQIAIAPLNDSAFNQGKSQLKALEYGAFGYFPVLQSLPPYLALKDLGMEHLPAWVPKNTEEQWYRVLRDATQDPGECLRRAVEYQQAVLSQCRYSQHIKEWLECYEKVLSSPPNHLPVPRNYGH